MFLLRFGLHRFVSFRLTLSCVPVLLSARSPWLRSSPGASSQRARSRRRSRVAPLALSAWGHRACGTRGALWGRFFVPSPGGRGRKAPGSASCPKKPTFVSPGGALPDGIRPSRTHIGREARDLHDRPEVDGAQVCPWNPCGGADRLVEILGVDQELAAELFARLCERPVGDERFAVAHPDAGRGRRRV